MKRIALLTACALLTAPSAGAPPLPAPAAGATGEAPPESLDFGVDAANRMTLPVMIGNQGPYRFVVDTGADRTVISHQLARELGLGAGQPVLIHSTSGAREVATFNLPRLIFGARRLAARTAPALDRSHLGAEGMLGLDSLQSQRVLFDFPNRTIHIASAMRARDSWPEGTIVVQGRRRLQRLVLADAAIDGERIWAIVDTGSQVTIANSALRQRLVRRGQLGASEAASLLSVTGGLVSADYVHVAKLRIGGVDIRDMPIAFADVHTFRQLDLIDRPAILLGMDVLQLFDQVSIDFLRREVRFVPIRSSSLDPGLLIARGGMAIARAN